MTRNTKIKLAVRKLPFASMILAPLLLRHRSYLKESGWFKSYRCGAAVTEGGQPVAWYTYAALEFLKERLNENMDVLEYGCGHSTLWFAARVRSVLALEQDPNWYSRLLPRVPSNVTLKCAEPALYPALAIAGKGKYHVIVNDGPDRVALSLHSVGLLAPDGVIIWDNSDRKIYSEGFEFLKMQGFKRIDFSGMGPSERHGWSTAVFYRNENCFHI